MDASFELSIDGATDEEAAAITAAIEAMLAAEAGAGATEDGVEPGSSWRFAARLDGIRRSVSAPPAVPSGRRWRTAARLHGGQ